MTTPQTYTQHSHPALAELIDDEIAKFNALPPEVQRFFAGEKNRTWEEGDASKKILPIYGSPKEIKPLGCIELITIVMSTNKASALWNAWRSAFPSDGVKNKILLEDHIFDQENIPTLFNSYPNFSPYAKTRFAPYFPYDFDNFKFGDRTVFKNIVFNQNVSFKEAFFGKNTKFTNVTFKGEVDFSIAHFGENTIFKDCIFEQDANFHTSDWGDYQEKSSISEESHEKKKRLADISFEGVHFKAAAKFNNRIFTGTTNFTNCNFANAPVFHGAKLPQDTNFEGALFPPASRDDSARRAYQTLKLAFSKMQATREEQRFFRLEMAEEAEMAKDPKKQNPDFKLMPSWYYALYQNVSDYGFSTWQPIKWLIVWPALIVVTLTVILAFVNGWRFGNFNLKDLCTTNI